MLDCVYVSFIHKILTIILWWNGQQAGAIFQITLKKLAAEIALVYK